MRIAALYDIHGNFPALKAVLQEVVQAQVDLIVVGGDVVSGPLPRQTLECLLNSSLPVQFVRGNADREVATQMINAAASDGADNESSLTGVLSWTADQMAPEHAPLMLNCPETIVVDIGGLGRVCFCHATPQNDTDIFTRLTPAERLVPFFEPVEASLVVCGHTHMQFDRQVGRVRVVNAGSVGMPYAEPGAYWLLLDGDVHFKRTEYDTAQAAECIRATSYPEAEDFAANNVVQPPTESEALDVFTRIEIGCGTAS